MKLFAIMTFAAVAATSSPVAAADWGGFYAGLLAGGGKTFGEVTDSILPGIGRADASPIVLGTYAGWDIPVSDVLSVGLEGQVLAKIGRNPTESIGPTSVPAFGLGQPDMTSGWEAFLNAKVGLLATEQLMLFASAGVALAEFSLNDLPCPSQCSSFQLSGRDVFGGTRTGYVAGLGVEYALDKNVTIRGQYQMADYGTLETPSDFDIDVARSSFTTHAVTVGLGYRFD